jgi:hypothetical protein
MKRLIITLSLFTTVQAQTLKEVHSYLYEVGMKHPDIVMSQIIQECGYEIDSYNATHRRNLTGWTVNGQLHTFGYWKSCIRAYKRWQDKYYVGDDYFEFLESKGYAEDKTYIKRVKSILSKLDGC